MKTEIVKDSKSAELDKPGIVTTHADGSFSIDGGLYLPEVKCDLQNIGTNFYKYFSPFSERKDFDINNFELKINQDVITNVVISMYDTGQSDSLCSRNVARQHIIKRHDGHYLKVEIINIVYATKRINCKCMSSSTRDGSLPDQILIQTKLDQFYCAGKANIDFTEEDLQSAINLMNHVRYGGADRWFFDVDFGFVRSFDPKTKKVIGKLLPIEAVQIAAQLNAKGEWDKVQRFDIIQRVETALHPSAKKLEKK
jgi:hypothetical protein